MGAQINTIGPSSTLSCSYPNKEISFDYNAYRWITWAIIWTIAGQTNAPVFPLPVLAIPIISRPLKAVGIA